MLDHINWARNFKGIRVSVNYWFLFFLYHRYEIACKDYFLIVYPAVLPTPLFVPCNIFRWTTLYFTAYTAKWIHLSTSASFSPYFALRLLFPLSLVLFSSLLLRSPLRSSRGAAGVVHCPPSRPLNLVPDVHRRSCAESSTFKIHTTVGNLHAPCPRLIAKTREVW